MPLARPQNRVLWYQRRSGALPGPAISRRTRTTQQELLAFSIGLQEKFDVRQLRAIFGSWFCDQGLLHAGVEVDGSSHSTGTWRPPPVRTQEWTPLELRIRTPRVVGMNMRVANTPKV
jgi:hypothetical protein